jgi:hypothetical protein
LVFGAAFGGSRPDKLLASAAFGARVDGYVEDDEALDGQRINGKPVWAGAHALDRALASTSARTLVADQHVSLERLAALREECACRAVNLVRVVASLESVVSSNAS